MDVNLLRSIVTVVSLLLFVALMVMVWLPRRKSGFDEAAALPFTGEATGSHSSHDAIVSQPAGRRETVGPASQGI